MLRYSTFRRVYQQRWCDVLKFRSRSMHLGQGLLLGNGFVGKIYTHILYHVKISLFSVVCSIRLRFSQCTICQQLTANMSDHSLSLEAKLTAVKVYRQHLHDQYVDRSACWALQDLSKDPLSGVLVILLDGIDQAKFSVPRDKGLRTSAELTLNPIGKTFCYCKSCFFS